MTNKNLGTLEDMIRQYTTLNETIIHCKEERDALKEHILAEMQSKGIVQHRTNFDAENDIKAEITNKTVVKVDYESLAFDLGISVASAKSKEALMELVEQGKLTLEKYSSYKYKEPKTDVKIKKVRLV